MTKRRPNWIDQNPLPLPAQILLKEATKTGKPYSKERIAEIDRAVAVIKRSYPQLY